RLHRRGSAGRRLQRDLLHRDLLAGARRGQCRRARRDALRPGPGRPRLLSPAGDPMIDTRTQSGFSLIELMVAILISSILLLGVLELFTNTSRTDRTSNELARVQENGRLVMELLSREARRAGYQGCVAASNTTTDGGVTYPNDAIAGTATSLTFRYARPTAGGTFPDRDCDNSALAGYEITFSNCGDNLCVTA